MLTIKKLGCGAYRVRYMFAEYSNVIYPTLRESLDLCRLRCHKILKDDNLVVIKVPFIGLWLVW